MSERVTMAVALAPELRISKEFGSRSGRFPLFSGWFSFTLFAACVFACMVYLWVPASLGDPDLWWHLRDVQLQLSGHSFLTRDLYSFTASGAPWINHEWLAEIPFYVGWRLWGERGIYLVMVGAIEAILLGVFYLAYRKSGSIAATMIVSVAGAAIATVSFGPRTLLFGWICLVLELMIFEQLRREIRYAFLLPVLFLFWVNLHGSWLIGIVLLLLFVVCNQVPLKLGLVDSERWSAHRTRPLLLGSILSVCALFVNPYGWRLVVYPFDLAFLQKLNVATIEEWKSLDFHSPRGKVFLVAIGVLFVTQLVKTARWRLYEVALLLVGIYASVTYSRFLFLGAILVMPILARYLPTGAKEHSTRHVGWLGIIVLLALAPVVVRRFPAASLMKAESGTYPVRALPYLHQFRPQGRVFNEFLWGGYLEWNIHGLPVFIDSRVDIFERNGTFQDYLDVVHLKQPLAILDKYKIRYVLFEENAPLSYLLEQSSQWKVDYRDGTAILLERRGSEFIQ